MLIARHAARGQTLPFWVMSILVALTLAFFVSNYANTVKNQIHAQNAADSAATAALGKDAAALNSTQTLLAAFDIQQVRTRDVAAALPYVLGTNPCGATNLLTPTCTTALEGAATDLANANKSLANVAQTLQNFQGGLLNGQLTGTLTNPNATIATLFAPNGSNGCSVQILTDCDYKYTTYLTYDSTGLPTVDEYACKKITNTAYSFLHIAGMGTYYSIGHTTSTLAPLSTTYNPATLGAAFAATAPVFPSIAGSGVIGDLSGLNINSAFFAATGAPPLKTPARSATDVCPA